MKVVIVGGGVIGLCSAYYLQKEGHDITVIDKGNITEGTSFGNAGYVSPSHFTPLASPGMVIKGLKWMMSSSSPFYIKPRLNADLARWSYAFWRNANAKTMNRNINDATIAYVNPNKKWLHVQTDSAFKIIILL